MKNYVCEGDTFVVPAVTAAVASGDVVIVSDLVGVAKSAAAIGEDVVCQQEGCFALPKDAAAIAQGVKVYFDTTAKTATATMGANKLIGRARSAALAGDTTVNVILTLAN